MKRTSPYFPVELSFTNTISAFLSILFMSCLTLSSKAQTEDQKEVHSDRAADDLFGHAVAISGDYALVGAIGEDEDIEGANTQEVAGSIYIYKRDESGSWSQLKKVVASDRESPDQFGYSLAIDGNIAVVGAHLDYGETVGEAGAAYIFEKDLGGTDNWGEVKKIVAADRDNLDVFGTSVAISGDYIIVGAYHEDEDADGINTIERSGSAYIFKRDLGGTDNWGQLKKIVASDRDDFDDFGWSVAISGDYAVVGARFDEHDQFGVNPIPDAGSAYIFQMDEGGVDNWGEIKKIVSSDRLIRQYFGWSVTISGNNILVGANGRGAFLFNKDEGGTDNWGEVTPLIPEDFKFGSYGKSVSLNGDYALIGAPADDFDQNGTNELDDAGAAFLFKREGDVWLEVQKLVASDRASGDRFGDAVAITEAGDFIVGATGEDEDESGMNTAQDAGSAYFFGPKMTQFITFEALVDKTYGDGAFVVVATSSSGLPVEFTTANASSGFEFDEGPTPVVATVSGSTVTVVSAGLIDLVATQAGDDTYWSTRTIQSLAVSKALVTATAEDKSRDYRGEDPVFTVNYTGFVNGEDENDLDFLPEIEVDANEESSVGEYTIGLTGGFDRNYEFDYVEGTLTINKIPLLITLGDLSRLYGDENPEEDDFTISFLGFPEGEGEGVLGDLSISINANETSDVGTYPMRIGEVSSDNYTITLSDGTLTIDPAPLTASADDQVIIYGEQPIYTISYSGFVNGEDESEFESIPEIGLHDDGINVGSYPILVSGGIIQNYDVSYESGTLTINQSVLMAKADDKIITYGEATPNYTITYSGFVNGEDESVLLTTPSADTEITPVNAGTYLIGVFGGSALNYSISGESGTLTINQAPLEISAEDKSRSYGDENPILTFTYSGFVNGEDEAVLENTPAISTEAIVSSSVGTYPISLSGGSAQNYSLNLVSGILTVNQALLTVSANDQTKTYGAENPELTIDYSGFVNEEDESVLITLPTISTEANETSNVGEYAIFLSSGTAQNYVFELIEGSLTISEAALEVIADDQMRTYGTENSELTLSYNGFVNGDDAFAVTALPIVSTSADQTSNVGEYVISLSGGDAQNYSLTLINGLLTVTQATLVAIADNQNINVGDNLPEFTISYEGFLNGDGREGLTVPPSAIVEIQNSNTAGVFDIILTEGSDDNYEFELVNGTLTIEDVLGTSYVNAINVYPNPVVDWITVNDLSVTYVEVYNLKGELTLAQNIDIRMDLSTLQPGVYLLMLRDSDGLLLSTNRVVKR